MTLQCCRPQCRLIGSAPYGRLRIAEHNAGLVCPTSVSSAVSLRAVWCAAGLPLEALPCHSHSQTWTVALLQATVQAALALSPLDAVQLAYPNKNAPGAAQYYEWAHEVVTIAIFCILICATVGTLLIRISAPQLLEKVSRSRRLEVKGVAWPTPACRSPPLWAPCPSASLPPNCFSM